MSIHQLAAELAPMLRRYQPAPPPRKTPQQRTAECMRRLRAQRNAQGLRQDGRPRRGKPPGRVTRAKFKCSACGWLKLWSGPCPKCHK